MKTYWASGNYGNELELTLEQAQRGYHSGQCDRDVINLMPELKNQLIKINPETLKKELKECGAWTDKELNNHNDNLMRWVWLACGDVIDNTYVAE